MKILVVFGSQSDAKVAQPLVDALSVNCAVEYHVISAHRDHEKLQHKMQEWQGDAVVAGAGVAAALPGVVAAMTSAPVFGVPVPAQFGGIDSLASIAQMPPGVPVMTCGPQQVNEIVSFLKQYNAWNKVKNIHFVLQDGFAEAEEHLEKARSLAVEKGLEMTVSSQAREGAFNVICVTQAEDIQPHAFGLHVPFLMKEDVQKPETYLKVFAWANQGGMWVGANNTRNAVASLVRLIG